MWWFPALIMLFILCIFNLVCKFVKYFAKGTTSTINSTCYKLWKFMKIFVIVQPLVFLTSIKAHKFEFHLFETICLLFRNFSCFRLYNKCFKVPSYYLETFDFINHGSESIHLCIFFYSLSIITVDRYILNKQEHFYFLQTSTYFQPTCWQVWI